MRRVNTKGLGGGRHKCRHAVLLLNISEVMSVTITHIHVISKTGTKDIHCLVYVGYRVSTHNAMAMATLTQAAVPVAVTMVISVTPVVNLLKVLFTHIY